MLSAMIVRFTTHPHEMRAREADSLRWVRVITDSEIPQRGLESLSRTAAVQNQWDLTRAMDGVEGFSLANSPVARQWGRAHPGQLAGT
jgi:hypothetical protein